MAARLGVLVYGVMVYALFLVSVVYAIAFLAGTGAPTAVNGPVGAPVPVAVVVDLLLLSLFAVQHSVMARDRFKTWLTRRVPDAAERSTYVLASSVVLLAVFIVWQPLPGVVWDVAPGAGRTTLWVLYGIGWAVVVGSTFLIDHFDLFGLRQVWFFARGRPYVAPPFRTPLPYRLLRHPLMVGFFIAFWATPTMTVGHLLFAIVLSSYILVGVRYEERDLRAELPGYADYAARTPRFIPRLRAQAAARPSGQGSGSPFINRDV